MPDVKDKNKAICRLSAYSLFFSNSPQTGFYSIFPSVLFSVIPSEAEESRGNDSFLLPRGQGFILSFRAKPRNLVETKCSACFPFLLSPMWRREVDCAKYEHKTERGLLPDFSQKLFNKDKSKL